MENFLARLNRSVWSYGLPMAAAALAPSALCAPAYPARAGGGSPQELAGFMQAELARTRKIVEIAGIPLEK